ncbi:MAG TPA: glutamine-hydrolyzing carbamoyl-phosphate synthase small subunit [Planctomycetota bacterium]|nr:glutamine-hydrolyzing carbamoyl-phosphate synthase small subunit [Planctomycetota bacterium]
MRRKRPARLVLIDGTVFGGSAFGAEGERTGEVCFNTSMTGYQEIMTDPSYAGQIMTMTYPLIGNVGVNLEDEESPRPWVEGFIVREASRIRSNFRSTQSLDDYLRQHDVIGIEDVDTRRLVRHVRTEGAMMGILSTVDLDDASLLQKLKAATSYVDIDWMKAATCETPYDWTDGFTSEFSPPPPGGEWPPRRVAAIDYGMKRNILRYLTSVGCTVRVFPAAVTPEEIIQWSPDGVFLSNGPGCLDASPYAAECVRKLLGRFPIFGICMGHEVLGVALGGSITKLKFGHRGANHPVMHLETRRVEITAQNHGFVVGDDLFEKSNIRVTHVNLNDQTNEGLECTDIPAFSVQYHPEASPGPHDAAYLFARFARMLDGRS